MRHKSGPAKAVSLHALKMDRVEGRYAGADNPKTHLLLALSFRTPYSWTGRFQYFTHGIHPTAASSGRGGKMTQRILKTHLFTHMARI